MSRKGGTAISVLLICFSLNLRHRRREPLVLDGSEIGRSGAPGQVMPSGCKKDSRIRVADEEKG